MKSSQFIKESTTGISTNDLADVLYNRLESRYPDVVSDYGHEVVGDAVLQVAEFYAGAEELGTSDIGIMVREIIKTLERGRGNDLSELNKSTKLNEYWTIHTHDENDQPKFVGTPTKWYNFVIRTVLQHLKAGETVTVCSKDHKGVVSSVVIKPGDHVKSKLDGLSTTRAIDEAGSLPNSPMYKKYPDSKAGILEYMKNEYDPRFVKLIDLPTCRIHADPQVEGVWAVDSIKTGFRCIIYLAGYKNPWGDIREMNDNEEGGMPVSKASWLFNQGEITEQDLQNWVKEGNLEQKDIKKIIDPYGEMDEGLEEGWHDPRPDNTKWKKEGISAAKNKISKSKNPHKKGSSASYFWNVGHDSITNPRKNMAEGTVDEAKKKPAAPFWQTWNPDDYNNEQDFYNAASQAVLSYVQDKFGGQAWFKGGSYAYKVNVTKPNQIVASDGSVVKVANVAKGLEDYCDQGYFKAFVDSDPEYYNEYFRPVKQTKYSDQEDHEVANMHGESIEEAVSQKDIETAKQAKKDIADHEKNVKDKADKAVDNYKKGNVRANWGDKTKRRVEEGDSGWDDPAWEPKKPELDEDWYDEYKGRPLTVRAGKNPSGAHSPTGTFKIVEFNKTSEHGAELGIMRNGNIGYWDVILNEPPRFLNFYCGTMPITARQAFNLFQKNKGQIQEALGLPPDKLANPNNTPENQLKAKVHAEKLKSRNKYRKDNEKRQGKTYESAKFNELKSALNELLDEDGSGTCAGAVAAGPAGNLFTQPQKRVKEDSLIGGEQPSYTKKQDAEFVKRMRAKHGQNPHKKGTLKHDLWQQKRDEYLKGFAKDPHGALKAGDSIVDPYGEMDEGLEEDSAEDFLLRGGKIKPVNSLPKESAIMKGLQTEEQGGTKSNDKSFRISDFKINAFENMTLFKRWIRSPKTDTRGMPRSLGDHYENIVSNHSSLLESSSELSSRIREAKMFSKKFKGLDKRDSVRIKVGNKIALLSASIMPTDSFGKIEISGFTNPKEITKINLDHSNKIDTIEFSDGSRFPEASEFTTVSGVNITNTVFFPNASSASAAYTTAWMWITALEGKGWEVEHYMSESMKEGVSGSTFPFNVDHMPGPVIRPPVDGSKEFKIWLDTYNPKTKEEKERIRKVFAKSEKEALQQAITFVEQFGWEVDDYQVIEPK